MKKRIFTAIEISPEARQKVAAYIETLRAGFSEIKVGWAREEKLHLTLKFLGDVDEGRIDSITKSVDAAAAAIRGFKITIGGTGVFPNKIKARILWLGLADENDAIQILYNNLESECANAGFAKEKRKFSPHLTIGRLREPGRSYDLVEEHLANRFESFDTDVISFAVFESKLLSSGSVYSVIHRSEFGK